MKYLIILLLFLPFVLGAVDPSLEYCIHNGHNLEYGYCVFDDGNKCPVGEFKSGNCGSEYQKIPGCKWKGGVINNENDVCCEGLKSINVMGESRCYTPMSIVTFYFFFTPIGKTIGIGLLLFSLLLTIEVIAYIVMKVIKKLTS